MFGILKAVAKTAVSVVALPVAVVVDVAESSGLKSETGNHTSNSLDNVGESLKNVAKKVDKLISL